MSEPVLQNYQRFRNWVITKIKEYEAPEPIDFGFQYYADFKNFSFADSQASNSYTFAMGDHTSASSRGALSIGRYNESGVSDELFSIGNGSGVAAKRTVFKVVGDGSGSSASDCTVTVNGQVNASDGFFQNSDIKQKNIISDINLDKAYELVDKCQTIIYTLKEDPENKEQIGLIAQEVQEFFPELINTDKDGNLSLSYSKLTVVILKVLKDIIQRITSLEKNNK